MQTFALQTPSLFVKSKLAFLCVLLCIVTHGVYAQTVPPQQAPEDFLFEDTLSEPAVLMAQPDPDDSTSAISQIVTDSLLNLPSNYVPRVSMELLADRLSCIEGEIPLHLNPKVASFIDYFVVRNRKYTQMVLERKDYYFPIFEKYLKQYGLPQELKYLAIVESGLNFSAQSRVGAVGLWQFMPVTGKECGLALDYYYDERLEAEKATEAACKYLKRLYRVLGDWELVLASYNCGVGKVKRTVERTGKRTFWEVYPHLPMETRAYVPQFVALSYAVNFHKEHNIYPDPDSLLVEVNADTVQVNKAVSLPALANLLGVSFKTLKHLNPSLRRYATPEGKITTIRIPVETKAFFALNRQELIDSASVEVPLDLLASYVRKSDVRVIGGRALAHSGKGSARTKRNKRIRTQPDTSQEPLLASARVAGHDAKEAIAVKAVAPELPESVLPETTLNKTDLQSVNTRPALTDQAISQPDTEATIHKVEPGQGLFSIARMYDVDVAQLAKWNGLNIKDKLYAGQVLSIKEKSTKVERQEVELPLLVKAKYAKPEKVKTYEVQPGDTLWAICQKHEGLSVEALIRLNRLKNRKLTPGQKLIVG